MNQWQISQAISSFPNIINDWDRLNKKLFRSHPLLDSRFIQALLHHFGNTNIKLAVYITEDKEVQNLLLLQQRQPGIWGVFLPSQAQIAPILCSQPQSLPTLFKRLSPYSLSIELLAQDPEYTFTLHSLDNLEKMHHATTMNITIQGSFESYWQGRSKNLQRNIKRYFNRLGKSDISINIESHTSLGEIENALSRYGEMEIKSWKAKKGTAIHQNNQQGQFYLDLIKSFAKTGQAEILELYLNDVLTASRINLLHKNMLIILKTTYDENFSKYSPGRLLLYRLIEREFTLNRINHIEFYTNATTDQLSWSTGKRSIRHITLYRSIYLQKTFLLIRLLKNNLLRK